MLVICFRDSTMVNKPLSLNHHLGNMCLFIQPPNKQIEVPMSKKPTKERQLQLPTGFFLAKFLSYEGLTISSLVLWGILKGLKGARFL